VWDEAGAGADVVGGRHEEGPAPSVAVPASTTSHRGVAAEGNGLPPPPTKEGQTALDGEPRISCAA